MEEKELRELQDPSTWDAERGETRPGARSARAVVSVAFASQEFQEVAAYARKVDMKTSEFIRTAALERARRPVEVSVLGISTAVAGTALFPAGPLSTTRAPSTLRPVDEHLELIVRIAAG